MSIPATNLTNLHLSGALLDSSGNQMLKTSEATDAVNEVTIGNAATAGDPSLAATGDDTNIAIAVKGKGTGAVKLGQATSVGVQLVADQPVLDSAGNELMKFTKTADAINEITVGNQGAGADPQISATGGDTDIDLQLAGKGKGLVLLGSRTSAEASAGAATVNAQRGFVTSESLTTAAGAAYTLTLTNDKIGASSQVIPTVENGTNTQGIPVVSTSKVAAAGSVVILVYNLHASQALNGTIIISFMVV